jgi:hypothetical protein
VKEEARDKARIEDDIYSQLDYKQYLRKAELLC